MKNITTEEAVQTLKDFAMYGRYYSNNTEHHMKSSINRLLNELEKKDKIIDAMAKEWFELDTLFMIRGKNIHSKEQLKQYFEKEVKE